VKIKHEKKKRNSAEKTVGGKRKMYEEKNKKDLVAGQKPRKGGRGTKKREEVLGRKECPGEKNKEVE